MNTKELASIQHKFTDLVSQILREKDDSNWEIILKGYMETQADLFKLDFAHVDDNDSAEIRKLLNEIIQLNETLIDLTGPFHKKIVENLKHLKSGKKAHRAYNENTE